jgi:tetratricopeptide (TPR) repeat protein
VSRRPAEAEAALRTVLKQNPANIDAEIKLANLLVNSKKIDEAIKALEPNKTDLRISKRRVEILINANRAEQADKELDEILTRTPSALEILQMAAGLNIARQNFDQAEKRVARALEIDKKNPTTLYYLGMLRMSQPRPNLDEAVRALQVACQSPTVGTEARFALADCLRRKSDPDGAIKQLEDALKDKPNDKRIRLALLDAYASLQPPRWVDEERVLREAEQMPGYQPDVDLLTRSANMWSARGEYKVALEKITKAQDLTPDNTGLVRQQLTLLIKLRRYNEVLTKVDGLVAKDKNLWWAYQARAVAKREQGHKEEAIKDFELALDSANELKNDDAAQEIARVMGDAIGPDDAIARISGRAEKDDRFKLIIARLQQAKGDTAASVKTLEQVLAQADRLPPGDREGAYRFGGTIYLVANQPEKSRACYLELLKMAPDDMTALNNMACLLAESLTPAQPQEGLTYSQRAYDLMQKGNRRDPLVLDTHGWILTLCGQVDEGIDVLRKANQIRQIPDTHYHLGEAYLKKQFADEAMRELEMALELVKRNTTLKIEVDPTLPPKIEAAIGRAGVMMRQKKTAANAAP